MGNCFFLDECGVFSTALHEDLFIPHECGVWRAEVVLIADFAELMWFRPVDMFSTLGCKLVRSTKAMLLG
jgi:hypothetical protein